MFDIVISPNMCGNKNCIGLLPCYFGEIPPRVIQIEDEWNAPIEEIEEAMIGLISHETIEWLIVEEEEQQREVFGDLHDLIGKTELTDYIGNSDGLP